MQCELETEIFALGDRFPYSCGLSSVLELTSIPIDYIACLTHP